MKILHVTGHYTPQGGVEQYILSVARLLAAHGYGNAVLYTEQSRLTIRDGAWPAYYVRTDQTIAAQVQQILASEQPDVAYIHHVASPELVETLAERIPAVAYVHGFTAVCPGLGKYFRRGDTVCRRSFGWGCAPMHYLRRCSDARRPSTLARLMRTTTALRSALLHASRFLVGARYMADLLAQNGFPAGKIAVLPPHFLPDDLSLAYTPPGEPHSILYAGRLEIEKGVPYLLRALARLPGHVQMEVAGDGTQRSRYEALTHQLGLTRRVSFLGWLDEEEMGQALRRCAILVMPSIFPEPFGKSGIDAMVHGRPVVAFDMGGISDWLHDGVDGFLVPAKDVQVLAERIGQLVDDHRLREQMGRTGQAGVVARYAASCHLAALMAAFQAATNDDE